MYEKTIDYVDYNGEKQTKKCYFHLTKADVLDWLTTSGNYTLDKVIEKLVTSHNGKEIMGILKDLIYRSYGEKSIDGQRFIRSKEVKDNFFETEAYSELFIELATDASKCGEFFRKILPEDLSEEIDKFVKDNDNLPESLKDFLGNEEKKEEINENTSNTSN